MRRRSTTARADEEFDVAVSARDRRGEYADVGASERRCECRDVVADFLVYGGVADDAALGMFAAGFELRLDQRQQMQWGRRERQGDRQYRLQRDEADVDDHDIGPGREPLAFECADIC